MRLLAYALAAAAALSPSELLAVSAPVSGRVVDNGGHAVAGALVSLVELHRAATTDRDGSFRFGDVPSGRYTISARHIGLISAAKEIVVETSPVNVSLTLDQRPTRIEPVNCRRWRLSASNERAVVR
jgi:protocatechuate 3,4-dioxygenase beta subunit